MEGVFFTQARLFSRVTAANSSAVAAPRSTKVYFFGLIGVIVIWGSSFVVVDAAVAFAPPLAIATWRFVFATIFFLLLTPIAKKRGFWHPASAGHNGNHGQPSANTPSAPPPLSARQYLAYTLLASIMGISLFFPAQYIAISIVGASIPALVVCLASPVITTLLAIAFFGERLIKLQVLGFVFATVGAFFILTGGDVSRLTPASPDFMGLLLALLTPFMWSVYNVAVKKAVQRGSSFQITSYTTYLGLAGLFIVLVLSGGFNAWLGAITRVEVLIATLYLAGGCSLFGYLVWNLALDRLQASRVGAFLYIEPFITVLFAWVFLSQGIAPVSLLGGGIVLVALVLILRHNDPSSSPKK